MSSKFLLHEVSGTGIVEFYRGKSIFITGGTGFLGKLLIEKLLRACEGIDTIYVLVRPKRGKNCQERIDEILEDEIFGELKKKQPKYYHKIIGIAGDASLPDLGLKKADKDTLIEKVNIIYHAAATVRFDEKLRLATAINVHGTKSALLLAHQCKNLCSMVHVSTAYCNCPHRNIDEKFYEPPYSAEELNKLVEASTDSYIENNLEEILKTWPNTYSFTKAIAENCVKTIGSSLPISIYRPAIVISTYQEPKRSWICNLYGPMGTVVGAGLGIMRSTYSDRTKVCDMVPGDYTVNGMIAASYENRLKKKEDEVKIYNYVSGAENPITWGDFHDLAVHFGMKNPSIRTVWVYGNTLNKNYLVHLITILFLHFLPALVADCVLRVTGNKPKFVNLYKKIHKISNILGLFSTTEWKFRNENVQKLWKSLPEIDRKVFQFSFDGEDFNWNRYTSTLGFGARIYLVKDLPSTIPDAKKKYQKLTRWNRNLQGILLFVALLICYRLAPSFSLT